LASLIGVTGLCNHGMKALPKFFGFCGSEFQFIDSHILTDIAKATSCRTVAMCIYFCHYHL
jgi:hypothetical protein